MIRCHNCVARADGSLALQPSSLVCQLLQLAHEGLHISPPDEAPALDLSSDELGELQIVEPNTPLRHADEGVLREMVHFHCPT
jgi:hypothetical protein